MRKDTFRPRADRLEDRTNPITPLPGAESLLASPIPLVSVGADTGGGPHVRVFAATGQEVYGFYAFEPGFTGGTRVATADFTGDGWDDIAVGAGIGGGPRVSLYDGRTGAMLQDIFAFEEAQRGGVFLGAGDVTGDGVFDLLVGAGPGGGPRVRVYEGGTLNPVRDFFGGDPNLRGGVYVAGGDLNDNGRPVIVAGTGRFNPAFINTFDAQTLQPLGSFEGYDEVDIFDSDDLNARQAAVNFRTTDRDIVGGIYFANVADVDGDGDRELPTGRVVGNADVRIFGDSGGRRDRSFEPFEDDEGDFRFATGYAGGGSGSVAAGAAGRATGEENFQGARPAAKDLNRDGVAELIVGSGGGGSRVLVYDGRSGDVVLRFDAFPGFQGGVTVG